MNLHERRLTPGCEAVLSLLFDGGSGLRFAGPARRCGRGRGEDAVRKRDFHRLHAVTISPFRRRQFGCQRGAVTIDQSRRRIAKELRESLRPKKI